MSTLISEHEPFVLDMKRGIAEGDYFPMLVYADWLYEHGSPAEEFFRLMAALAKDEPLPPGGKFFLDICYHEIRPGFHPNRKKPIKFRSMNGLVRSLDTRLPWSKLWNRATNEWRWSYYRGVSSCFDSLEYVIKNQSRKNLENGVRNRLAGLRGSIHHVVADFDKMTEDDQWYFLTEAEHSSLQSKAPRYNALLHAIRTNLDRYRELAQRIENAPYPRYQVTPLDPKAGLRFEKYLEEWQPKIAAALDVRARAEAALASLV